MRTVALSALTVAATLVVSCNEICAQTVDRAVYSVGDTWTYRHVDKGTLVRPGAFESTETRTVIEVLANEFVMSTVTTAAGGEKTTRTQRSSLDFNDYAQPNPDGPRLEIRTWVWPVEVGKTWKYEVPVASGVQVWTARVVAWEDVEVPAGKFRALKVEREMLSNPGGSSSHKVIVWYAPDAKANVKAQRYSTSRSAVTFDYIRELVAYQVH